MLLFNNPSASLSSQIGGGKPGSSRRLRIKGSPRSTHQKTSASPPLNLLGRFVAPSSPMADQGMFNLQLTSINRCFLEIQGISSFFRPSPLPRLLPNNAPQHTWSRCVLSVGMRTSAYQGDGITSCKPLATKGQSRTGRKRKKRSGTRDSTSNYNDDTPSFTDLFSISPTITRSSILPHNKHQKSQIGTQDPLVPD